MTPTTMTADYKILRRLVDEGDVLACFLNKLALTKLVDDGYVKLDKGYAIITDDGYDRLDELENA